MVAWMLGFVILLVSAVDAPGAVVLVAVFLAGAFILGAGAANSAALHGFLIGRYSGKAEPGLKGSLRYMRARFKATAKSLVPGTAIQAACIPMALAASEMLWGAEGAARAAIWLVLGLAALAWVFAWVLNSVAPAYSALSDDPDSPARFRRETWWGVKLAPHVLMRIGGFMLLAWLIVKSWHVLVLSLYGVPPWSPGMLEEIMPVGAPLFVFVSPAITIFLDADTISLPALLPVMLAVSIVNPALAYLLVRRVPQQSPPTTPLQAPRSRARRWARRATLALLALAAVAGARPAWNFDLVAEGQQTNNAVVTLSEALIDEFAYADSNRTEGANAASFRNDGPWPCSSNRASFQGAAALWVSGDTDVEALFDFVEANIEALGLKVRARRAEVLRLESRADTTFNVMSSGRLLRTPGRGPEMKVTITFMSSCLPRPAGYRGERSTRGLRADWPSLVGFKSGPLSEARIR